MDKYRIPPDTRVSLQQIDPDDKSSFDLSKSEGTKALRELRERIITLQRILYAENKHRLLVIIQAMDTGGKDGTVRHVFGGVDPLGIRVTSFKAPSERELEHDYLWRIHREIPAKGEIGVFNRSHYEDIIAVRVKKLAPESVWSKRYQHVIDFEKMLADEGTVILKFFLHISPEEQRERLLARLEDPAKHWKFNPADLEDRNRWSEFAHAYEEILSRTSTPHAPWFVIPANRKWHRNLVVATTVINALENLDMKFPAPGFDPSKIVID